MNPKSGIQTTEFWITVTVNIAGAILALIAAYGLIKQEYVDLWMSLIQSLAVAIIPLALALVNYAYIDSRGKVKAAAEIQKAAVINAQSEAVRNR